MSLHYYSRIRFAQNLLPLLQNAATADAGTGLPISRVISVLAAGYERPINTSDLSLKTTFSISNAANHATTMNTLALDSLAKENPSIGFIHSQPGGVDTNLLRDFNKIAQYAGSALLLLLRPLGMMTPIKESGERHTWAATNEEFKAGAHFIGPKGDFSLNTKLIDQYRADGTQKKVQEHTAEIFASIPKGDKPT
jgi:hypothetical protein